MRVQREWLDLLGWAADWTGDLDGRAIARRAEYLRFARLQNIAFISDMVERVRRERLMLVERYAPPFKRRLQMESRVAATNDIRKLLDLASRPGGNAIDRRRRYEAKLLFDQACLLAVIDTVDSYYQLSEDFEELLEALSEGFFGQGAREVDVPLALDPGDDYRVTNFAIRDPFDDAFKVEAIPTFLPQGLFTRCERGLPCRTLPDGRIVYVRERLKSPYDTYMKIQTRHAGDEADPFQVKDRGGLRLVVPTETQARRVIAELREFVRSIGGTADEPRDNFGIDRAVDIGNPDSAGSFNAVKVSLHWRNRTFEAQAMTFKDYFSTEYSVGDERHEVYKRRRALRNFLPLNFASGIYGVDWDAVAGDLIGHKRRELRHHYESGMA